MSLAFSDNFLWGSATAAYQVEGAVAEAATTVFKHRRRNDEISLDEIERITV